MPCPPKSVGLGKDQSSDQMALPQRPGSTALRPGLKNRIANLGVQPNTPVFRSKTFCRTHTAVTSRLSGFPVLRQTHT